MRRVLTVLASVMVLSLIVLGSVWSAPPQNADPTLAPWFNSLRQPGTGVSCCSIADCRPVDYRGGPGGYEVWIDNSWHPVPADKVLDGKDNPIGRAVVCYTPALGVLCFVRGTEA
jgi:hypothetical protein